MSSSLRRLAAQVPQFTKGLQTSAQARAGDIKPFSHESVVLGDGHHGLRPGYTYDYEHGPHYLNPRAVPNFMWKWNVGVKVMFAVAASIPCFAVYYQQKKTGKW